MRITTTLLLLFTTVGIAGVVCADGKVQLFDGKSLKGWYALPKDSRSDWFVENGKIVGLGSKSRLSYLVWDDAELKDFVLEFSYRMATDGNSGVEIHAHRDTSGKRPFEGYHADFGHVGIGPQVLGAWDFHFAKRGEHPCPRGVRIHINSDNSIKTEKIKNAVTLKDIKRRDWNHVRVVAKGRNYRFYINGKLASEFTDNAKVGRCDKGLIALQLHDKGMRVEFKDLRLTKN